ncbi:2-C-methyl-D-erythritol 4-phosphate cytidylyltransferase [Bacillus carboniphilus]|uniref:2-C-methyl-D-erythritol 4-phosphate cytidylyltransferase n=1 Tax=Bacillus carboniphilus TaxID=86663 RepID=A0ABY9JUH4_9BACI|nr:2-C-methyl-D-erythritol 4-phosphate cytidylyltransferase [Bacillus carboniphilus]WLR41958.1 2-C-methyl-D-erythritol 4-phosphate cytidylyltransferase [Bacillus carboniphilus]
MKYTVVVVAAGKGTRMKAEQSKQLIKLNSIPIFIHTLNIFENDPNCQRVILVINEKEENEIRNNLLKFNIKKVKDLVPGGKERQESVYKGLQLVNPDSVVLIHDGARPFVSINKLKELVVNASEIGAATLAVRVKDTVKKVGTEGHVVETLDRSCLWAVHTPQAFTLSKILHAHQYAREKNMIATDDCSLLESIGDKVAIVEDDYMNIKITTPEDLVFAKAILEYKSSCHT